MNEIPLVTVVVPIYNVEEYLNRCLDSVVKQTYSNFEVIMVNDGSTDNSGVIAESYLKYSNFTLISQENKGLGGARNTGILHARGKYIAFPDSDDWLHKDYLRLMVEAAEDNDADIVTCGADHVWANGLHKRRASSNTHEGIIYDKEEFLRTASYVTWDKIFKLSLFDGIYFPEHMSKQDYACIPRVIARANKIYGINTVLYYYFYRSNSATNKIKVNYNLLKAQQILEESELSINYPEVLAVYFVRNIMGTLLCNMMNDYSMKNEVQSIMEDGKEKYPNLKKYIKKGYIGSPRVGKLLYNGQYRLAFCFLKVKKICHDIWKSLFARKSSVGG